MKTINLKSFLLGGLSGAAAILVVGAGQGSTSNSPIEHKIVQGTVYGGDISLTRMINRETTDGWALVSAHHAKDEYGFALLSRSAR